MVREVTTRVCGLQDMKCYKKVEEESHRRDLCGCLLECGEIEYKTEQKLINFVKYVYQRLLENSLDLPNLLIFPGTQENSTMNSFMTFTRAKF
jgi:hypothetical protein